MRNFRKFGSSLNVDEYRKILSVNRVIGIAGMLGTAGPLLAWSQNPSSSKGGLISTAMRFTRSRRE
jgi:hypothetical protein